MQRKKGTLNDCFQSGDENSQNLKSKITNSSKLDNLIRIIFIAGNDRQYNQCRHHTPQLVSHIHPHYTWQRYHSPPCPPHSHQGGENSQFSLKTNLPSVGREKPHSPTETSSSSALEKRLCEEIPVSHVLVH